MDKNGLKSCGQAPIRARETIAIQTVNLIEQSAPRRFARTLELRIRLAHTAQIMHQCMGIRVGQRDDLMIGNRQRKTGALHKSTGGLHVDARRHAGAYAARQRKLSVP